MDKVWTKATEDNCEYVLRCGVCGVYDDYVPCFLHWFFRGIYCRNCVQYMLYGDYRTIEEINERKFTSNGR